MVTGNVSSNQNHNQKIILVRFYTYMHTDACTSLNKPAGFHQFVLCKSHCLTGHKTPSYLLNSTLQNNWLGGWGGVVALTLYCSF